MKTRSILSIIIILLFLTGISNALTQPDEPEHQKTACYYCHAVRGFSIGNFDDEQVGCNYCHDFASNSQLMEQDHNPRTCKVCHNIQDKNAYHRLHNNVSCQTCHSSGQKPKSSFDNCSGCHGTKIHDIHQNKIEKICSGCHGGSSSTPQSAPLSKSSTPTSSDQNKLSSVYAKIIDYKKYTLFEIFKKLLSTF